MQYDITDFDPFIDYSGCKCSGGCQCVGDSSGCSCSGGCQCAGDSISYGGCGCSVNFTGDDYMGLSISKMPQVIGDGTPVVSEGDPVEVTAPVVATAPVTDRTVTMGINKKHIKILAIAAIGYVSYKYLLKPIVK